MMSAPAKKVEEPTPKPSEDSNEDSGGTLRLENDEVTSEKRPVGLIDRKVPVSWTGFIEIMGKYTGFGHG